MDHAAATEAAKQYAALTKGMSPMEVYRTLTELNFPQKIWTLSKLNVDGIVRWNTDGTALEFDVVKLKDYIEAPFSLFKLHTLPAFASELERHQFEVVDKESINSCGHQMWVYKHKYFLRDQNGLLLKIVPLSPDEQKDTPEEEVKVKTPTADDKPEKPTEDVKPPAENIWPSKANFFRHIRDTSTAAADGINPQVGQHDPRVLLERPLDLKNFFQKSMNLRVRYVPPKWEDMQKELQKDLQKDDSTKTNPQPSTSRQAQDDGESQTDRYKKK